MNDFNVFLGLDLNRDPATLGPAFQELKQSKNPEVVALLTAYASFEYSIIPLEFIKTVRSLNDFALFSSVLGYKVKITDHKVIKEVYKWFVETKNSQIIRRFDVRFKEQRAWLEAHSAEMVAYAIEWKDYPFLKYCSENFRLDVPTLRVMIERAPVHLEILMLSWLRLFCHNAPVDIVDCILEHYHGTNKVRLLASICCLAGFRNVDVVRRVVDNYPEALSCVQDWGVYPPNLEVCELLMLNGFGHKLNPVRLADKHPQFLTDYQKDVRLAEFMNQLDHNSVRNSNACDSWKYTMLQRIKLCKIANIQIDVGDLACQTLSLSPVSLRRLSPTPEADAVVFTEYMNLQSPEYRQAFKEAMAAFCDLHSKWGELPEWANI